MTFLFKLLALSVFLSWPFPVLLTIIIVRLKHRHEAYPHFELRALGSMPPSVGESLAEDVRKLETLGFALVSYLYSRKEWPQTEIYLALLKNQVSGDMALTAEMFVEVNHVRRNASVKEFSTELPSGADINTTNSQFSCFKRDPENIVFRFPEVKGLGTLYKVHRRLLDRHAPDQKGILPSEGREVAHLSYSTTKNMRRQVEFGYFQLDDAKDVFRPTWKGAVLMTVRQAWPAKQILRASMRSKARSTLTSLGIRP